MIPLSNRNSIREEQVIKFLTYLSSVGEDVVRTKNNRLAYPITDKDGNEGFIEITISIPANRDGEEYDAYEEAQNYKFLCAEKEKKQKENEKKKRQKIARDEAARKQKKKSKGE